MHITARKQPRPFVGNGHLKMQLPMPTRELWPAQESLYLRETLHNLIDGWLGERRATHFLPPAFQLSGLEAHQGTWMPPVNVRENDDEVIIECYLPGVSKGDIEVEVKNGTTLVIKGARKLPRNEAEPEAYLRREFFFSNFYRCFALPLEVKPDGITTHYRDGILELCLIKKEEVKKNTYSVTVQG